MRISASKTALIKFIFEAWRNDPYPEKLCSKLFFITCEKQHFKVTKDGSEVVAELTTSQEEAGTPILLHIKYASSNDRSMVIVTEDIDVFIICLSVFRQICGNMYIRCVTKNSLAILTLAKLGSFLVKRLVKPYKDVMLIPGATHSAPLVVW